MYKLVILAALCPSVTYEGVASQRITVFPIGQSLLPKTSECGILDWEYGGWGQRREELSDICKAIADDLKEIIMGISGFGLRAILNYAKDNDCAHLPIARSKYIAKDDINFAAYVFLVWEDDFAGITNRFYRARDAR